MIKKSKEWWSNWKNIYIYYKFGLKDEIESQ
jgi:hypothetical protein